MQYIEHQVGDLVVSQRQLDGYISASKLSKAYERQTGKYRNPNAWFEKDRTIEYLELLSDKTGKYLGKINYTYLTPLLPLASCLLPIFTRKLILHDYLLKSMI